jgi:formylglycine-generating enzyme required for sulfatase activity
LSNLRIADDPVGSACEDITIGALSFVCGLRLWLQSVSMWKLMNAAILRQIASLMLFATNCLAQADAKQTRDQSDSMVLVRGGTIMVGIDADEIPRFQKTFDIDTAQLFQDEMPKHSVTLDDFYIDKYLVTNAQFKSFVDANPEWQPERIPRELDNGNYLRHWTASAGLDRTAAHPVVNVSWYAAVAYCRWVGKRLPTEAEWEYAARGGLSALFPWGDEPVDKTRANYTGIGLKTTSPVGTYPANRYGLFDMAGNVWQFVVDQWMPYSSMPQKNPVAGENRYLDGAAFLKVKARRVIRGGSFDGVPVNLWVEYRDSHPPNDSRDFVGFRCAK